MYEDQSGEFVCGYWDLKGYNPWVRGKNNELSLGISSTWMKVFMNLFCIICLFFFLQEVIKKKLEIQKQKQELLNKQIKKQKVKIMNFIAAVCLTSYPPSHFVGYFLDLLAAHLVCLRSVKLVGRRNKRLLTKKGIRQDEKIRIAALLE